METRFWPKPKTRTIFMIDFDKIKVDNFYVIKVSLKLMGFGCPKTEEGRDAGPRTTE